MADTIYIPIDINYYIGSCSIGSINNNLNIMFTNIGISSVSIPNYCVKNYINLSERFNITENRPEISLKSSIPLDIPQSYVQNLIEGSYFIEGVGEYLEKDLYIKHNDSILKVVNAGNKNIIDTFNCLLKYKITSNEITFIYGDLIIKKKINTEMTKGSINLTVNLNCNDVYFNVRVYNRDYNQYICDAVLRDDGILKIDNLDKRSSYDIILYDKDSYYSNQCISAIKPK